MYHSYLGNLLAALPLLQAAVAHAVPRVDDLADLRNATPAFEEHAENSSNVLNERAGSFYLRILPLGGSIAAGWGSSTGNG